MPKNPNKSYCQTPGCKAWAMRGYHHCRSHLDNLLGKRGAGAPAGNTNALKSGRTASTLSKSQLNRLAYDLIQDPAAIPDRVHQVAGDIAGRSGNPYKTILLLSRLLAELAPLVADGLFTAALDELLEKVHPGHRDATRIIIWKLCLPFEPGDRLSLIRSILSEVGPKLEGSGKTITGTGPT